MESLPNFEKWPLKYSDVIENGVIKYNGAFYLPSLQYISSVHLVIHFWCKHLKDFKYELTWHQVCLLGNKIIGELDDIIKPKCLRSNIAYLVILIGQEICDWVKFYDYYVCKKQNNKKCISIKYVDKIVWSPRGSINHLKTAKAMRSVRKSLLYKVCCILCDDCANWDENLIGHLVFEWKIDMLTDDDLCRFWKGFMHRSEEEFEKMQCKYCFPREVSRFLRDTPGSEYNMNIIMNLPVQLKLTIEYWCYFLSKLDISQQCMWMEYDTFFDVIHQFLTQPTYLDYFLPILYFVKNIISENSFCNLLFSLNYLIADHSSYGINAYTYLYEKYVFIFKEVWFFLPEDVKDYVLSVKIKAFDWLWQRHSISMLGTFFAHRRSSVKRTILFNRLALDLCAKLIMFGEWEMFEQYICPVFFNTQDEEAILLKREFVFEMKRLFYYFIRHKLWKDLDRFFNWCYDDETKRTQQKKMLLREVFNYELCNFRFMSKKTSRSLNSNIVADFTLYEHLLQWYFRTRKDIVKFKQTELCKTPDFTDIIRHMIKRKRLDIIEQFLSWCFSNKKRLIKQYKKNFGNELTALEEYATQTSHLKRRRLS